MKIFMEDLDNFNHNVFRVLLLCFNNQQIKGVSDNKDDK